MRHRFTVVFLIIVCAVVALTMHLASAGTAGETRFARTFPTATSQTTAVTLASSQSAVGLMDPVVLTGRVIPAQRGVTVELWSKMFNAAWRYTGARATASDGTFEIKSKVYIKTAFQARLPQASSTTSNVVTVNTRPTLGISPNFSGVDHSLFRVGAQVGTLSFSLSGKFALVQRAIGAGRWVTLRRVTLRREAFPTQYATRPLFRLKLPRGPSYLRAFLPRSQLAPAYLPTASRGIHVKR